jgi:hypothetical protein
LVYSILNDPGHGTLSFFNPVGVVTYTPAPDFNGEDSFVFEVGNGTATSSALVTMTVTPVDDPVGINAIATTTATAGDTVTFTATANDVDHDTLVWSLENAPAGSTVDSSGVFSWDSGTSTADTYTFVVGVSDGHMLATTSAEVVLLDPPPPPPAPVSSPRHHGAGGSTIISVPLVAPVETSGEVLGTSTYTFANNIAYGDISNDVVELQKRLIAEGYLPITVPTGFFGPLTLAAVKKYQAGHGIIQTGYVGPLTRGALNGR